ncbi:MAG: LPXTG cell wall anchor domain-containing protein, partial [Acidobacteria bacterium]|nr:LPXTG cell wall anchor domain-containing protein [Acidobacteriota bacterium]
QPEVTAPALTEAIAPPASQLATTPPVLPVLAKPEPERQVLAEDTTPRPMQASVTALPKTAGHYTLLPVMGLVLLAGGCAILYRRKQASYATSKS